MKTKILILIVTAVVCSTSLFSQRAATTGHSVAYGVSTQVYIFGGQKSDGSLSNELWVTNNFDDFIPVNAPGGPSPRKDHDSWIVGNLLYIRGGVDANGNCISDFWELNLLTGTWTQYTDLLPACNHKKAVVKANSNVYLVGGTNSSGASVPNFGTITTSSYTPKANMIEPLSGCGTFTKNGNIFVYGGFNNDWDTNSAGNQPSYSQNTWKYTVATNSWELQPTSKSQIIELKDMAYTQDNSENFFYVFGGITYDYGTNTEIYTDGIYKLDLNTFTWTKFSTTLPYALANFTATFKQGTNSTADTIFLLGGRKATGALSDNLFKFLPSTGQIITVPLVTSISTRKFENVQLYPNPAHDLLFVKNVDKNSIVTIYDITGKQILNTKLQNEQLNISELPKGFYTIRIKSEDNEIINKFVKQ